MIPITSKVQCDETPHRQHWLHQQQITTN